MSVRKFTNDELDRCPRMREMVCKEPFSIPESDGIVTFDTSEELGAYLEKEKK